MYQTGTHGSVGGRLANQSSASYPIVSFIMVRNDIIGALYWCCWECFFRQAKTKALFPRKNIIE